MTTWKTITVVAVAALIPLSCAVAQDRTSLVERGGAAFMANGCHGCHTVGKMGTPIGPDLSRIGFKYREEYLERWLRDPSFMRPSAHMPKLEIKESDVQAIAAYLATLR